MTQFVVYEIVWADEVIDKIAREHDLSVREVEQAVIEDPDRQARWTTEKAAQHGGRLAVVGSTWVTPS